MNIEKLISTVTAFFARVLNKPGEVVGVTKEDEGWKVYIEVAEETEYMRKTARDDLLAIYEVTVDDNQEIIGFERRSMRARGSTTIPEGN